jgi:hypothetical protein
MSSRQTEIDASWQVIADAINAETAASAGDRPIMSSGGLVDASSRCARLAGAKERLSAMLVGGSRLGQYAAPERSAGYTPERLAEMDRRAAASPGSRFRP